MAALCKELQASLCQARRDPAIYNLSGAQTDLMQLTPAAVQYREEVERRRIATLGEVDRLPVAILIWGPSPNAATPAATTRVKLRDELIRDGHLAQFSEDLIDPNSGHSIQIQQLAHVQSHDIVFSIPDSPGSIAEIHDFAKVPVLAHKIVTFLDRGWNDGYSNLALLGFQSQVTTKIELYDAGDLPTCIIDKARAIVRGLQESYYFWGRRP